MDKPDYKSLFLTLLQADTETEVISILTEAGYWNDKKSWRYYGDRDTNFNAIGNQQSRPDAALVEKIVNSVDARLMNECLLRGIDPKSESAPSSVQNAVAEFFAEGTSTHRASDGVISNWSDSYRTKTARGITVAATGFGPREGKPCLTIADCGEGQTPDDLPYTILSLDRDNKQKIHFVQGKFNMGGTGVLKFCGKTHLQLVLSRRNPKLLRKNASQSDQQWGFTIVRRDSPDEGNRSSVHSYLGIAEKLLFHLVECFNEDG